MERSYGAIVSRMKSQQEYLLVHHLHGHWDIPKGHPNPHESHQEAARREVHEETGYRIGIVDGFSETIEYRLPSGTPKRVTLFLGEVESYDKKHKGDPEEIIRVEWVDYQTALDRMTYQNSKEVLRKAHEILCHS